MTKQAWQLVFAALAACGDSTVVDPAPAGGTAPPPPPKAKIEHVVVIVQENHTFDTYFGRWCTAPAGSNPTCNDGPGCCEAAPATEPSGAPPIAIDDAATGSYDPNHSQPCELAEMNDGKMDRFVTGALCSNPKNFGIVNADIAAPYHDYATKYAIADRYFQSIAGASSANDMYLAVAKYVFTDNAEEPKTIGAICSGNTNTTQRSGEKTIADVLASAGATFAFYAAGYDTMKAANGACPNPPVECVAQIQAWPCLYDPSDVPFAYYAQHADDPKTMKDYVALEKDVSAGTLPNVAFVKAIGWKTEHPGNGITASKGIGFVKDTVDLVLGSPYAESTLVLVTWDEGGGYFDHVPPPPASTVDQQPYGTRVPLIAIGKFAKKGFVSHVTMEHSSIVRFLEQSFTGQTGQLGARDAVVNGIESLLVE